MKYIALLLLVASIGCAQTTQLNFIETDSIRFVRKASTGSADLKRAAVQKIDAVKITLPDTSGELALKSQVVTQIVAGTNVTISPATGVGAVTVNATASGGVASVGGWTSLPGSSKAYTTSSGGTTHIRQAAGDTTRTGLFNIYGTVTGTWDGDNIPSTKVVGAISGTSLVGSFVRVNSSGYYEGSTYMPSSFIAAGTLGSAAYASSADFFPALGSATALTDFDWASLAAKPSSFTPSEHWQSWETILVGTSGATLDGYLTTALGTKATWGTTLAGYGITNAYTKTESDARYVTPLQVSGASVYSALFAEKAAEATNVTRTSTLYVADIAVGSDAADDWAWVSRDGHTHDFDLLAKLPTTLAGFGITNAYTKTESDAVKVTFGASLQTMDMWDEISSSWIAISKRSLLINNAHQFYILTID